MLYVTTKHEIYFSSHRCVILLNVRWASSLPQKLNCVTIRCLNFRHYNPIETWPMPNLRDSEVHQRLTLNSLVKDRIDWPLSLKTRLSQSTDLLIKGNSKFAFFVIILICDDQSTYLLISVML